MKLTHMQSSSFVKSIHSTFKILHKFRTTISANYPTQPSPPIFSPLFNPLNQLTNINLQITHGKYGNVQNISTNKTKLFRAEEVAKVRSRRMGFPSEEV